MARAKKKTKDIMEEIAEQMQATDVSAEVELTEEHPPVEAESEVVIEEIVTEETVAEETETVEDIIADAEVLMEEVAVSTGVDASTLPEEEPEPLAITQEDVRLVEAILFASSSSLSVGQIAERFPQERVSLIPDVLELLREQYASRGVNLVQRENRWALRTATDLGDSLRLEKEQPKKFTRAAMETMAIVAYHQPVTRAEIENIRGVATSPGALDALMEAGWIKPGKRREVPGRPVTWLSTQGFLDHFGLEKLEDLPGMEELKAAGLLDKRPAVEAMPTADLFDESETKDIDPNEVTDEDLMGKVESDDDASETEDNEDDIDTSAVVSEDADDAEQDDDTSEDDDYSDNDEDEDDESEDDADEEDEDSDDEDSDEEDSDDEDADDDSDDEDSDDEDDEDYDDEDDDDEDSDDEEDDEDKE